MSFFSQVNKFFTRKISLKTFQRKSLGIRLYSSTENAVPLNSLPLSKIRNVGIIAHIDAGKTTTTERMLFFSGSIKRIGDVDQGDTITDYLQAERDRGITIQSAAVTIPWNSHKINIIDTPGHADFTFEVIRSLRVLDGAVTILDAVAGVEAQTEKVWKQAKALKLPTIIYINKMDRVGSGFSRTCKEIIAKLRTKIVLTNIPYFVEDQITNEPIFRGVVDVLTRKLLIWDPSKDEYGTNIKVVDLEKKESQLEYPKCYDELCAAREATIETLCEFDDDLVDEFLESDEDYLAVSTKVIKKALRNATLNNNVSPVLCGASFKNIGVQPLLDAVVDYLPNPNETARPEITTKFSFNKKKKNKSKKTDEETIENIAQKVDNTSGLIINNNPRLSLGLAFKVITDDRNVPNIFVRVYSGKIQNGSTVLNTRTGKKFRITNLFLINGDITHRIDKLTCGNIGVVTVSLLSTTDTSTKSDNDESDSLGYSSGSSLELNDLNEIKTGDTMVCHMVKKDGLRSFSEKENGISLNPIIIPPSIFVTSLEPKALKDKRVLDDNLKILLREDPSLRVFENEEGQTLISGMGELHLEIVKDRLVNDMKTNCEISKVMVTYKETILKPTELLNKSVESNSKDPNDRLEIEFSIEPFEGQAGDHPLFETSKEDELFILPNDNNFVHIPFSAAPNSVRTFINQNGVELAKPMNENKNIDQMTQFVPWPLLVSYSQIFGAIVSACVSTLQNGGAIASLPLDSVLIKINKWRFPKNSTDLKSLLFLTRDTINESLRSLDSEKHFAILEPIMNIKVFTDTEDTGKVTHDLTSTRKAEILSIEHLEDIRDESDGGSNDVNYDKEAEKQYLPEDSTMSASKLNGAERNGVKVISGTAPLKEMIGYLSKLRSLTKGRGTFIMDYRGFNKVSKDRLSKVKEDL